MNRSDSDGTAQLMNMLTGFEGRDPPVLIKTVNAKQLDGLRLIAFRIAVPIKNISLPEHISHHW